jgi:hypothetical protein
MFTAEKATPFVCKILLMSPSKLIEHKLKRKSRRTIEKKMMIKLVNDR